jgi:hypothetical protein
MPPPAPINRDFQCYVNAIEEQRKQNNTALEILTSTLSASMTELSARLLETIQEMLAATVTQNQEEVKREKEAAKQEKAQEKLEHQREKAQEKLEHDRLRDHDFHQFNRTSGLVQTMYNHIQHTLPDAKHSLLTQTCDQALVIQLVNSSYRAIQHTRLQSPTSLHRMIVIQSHPQSQRVLTTIVTPNNQTAPTNGIR